MFDLKRPCATCPFLKVGGIRLHKDRAREIAGYFTDAQGGTFACHSTIDYNQDEDNDDEQMCVGGMVFADKQNKANQIVRIMERCGAIDWPTLRKSRPLVFDSVRQMIKAQG
jgi:hypothetical protein